VTKYTKRESQNLCMCVCVCVCYPSALCPLPSAHAHAQLHVLLDLPMFTHSLTTHPLTHYSPTHSLLTPIRTLSSPSRDAVRIAPLYI
jgi:hypothetical protein